MELVTVEIPQGQLRGKKVTSNSNGVTYYSFQGIPYAKPPVGPLRFKPPKDAEPWKGVRDATVEGAIAPQVDFRSKRLVGDEDSLFLNVFVPQWPATSPKAVMVWIHGGAFIMGSGNADIYGPAFLVAEDVVVVTINYRIGTLGFLYLEGADVTGNNGLRDQVMALKWVRNNIAHFGGDPGNVTIFGESAGGASVHYLMLSPLAAGLFHRAIAQSGTALLCGGATPREVSCQRTLRLAKFLGCTSEDPQEVADFLRTVPAEKIVVHQSEVLSEEDKDRLSTLPVLPSEEVGLEAFLPDSPRNLLHEGNYMKVPFITGATSAEGKVMLMELFLHKKLSEVGQHFENVIPTDLAPKIGTERSKEIANIVKKFYFGEKDLDDTTVVQYIDMMSDFLFLYPLHETVQSHIRWSPHPTYVYLFDHINEAGINTLTGTVDNLPGAPHSAELMYLFDASLMQAIGFRPESTDAKVRAECIQLWSQFAKTGNPSRDAGNLTWTPATKGKLNYMNINGGCRMDKDMFKSRMEFLDELYSKFLPRETK